MKKIALVTAFATMGACTPAAETEAPAEPVATKAATAAMTAADGGPSEGLYRVVDANGVTLIEELRSDGTYSFMEENRTVIEEGRWDQKSPDELCFTASGIGAIETCYVEHVGKGGVWRSTNRATGEVAVIERIAR